jgi:ectoine hydroxylase-related dioxygenase (phytanoyl-CoA dioxygenase family)
MTPRIKNFDLEQLDSAGFAVLPDLVQQHELMTFERNIAAVGEVLASQRGVERRSDEPIADVLKAAGRHRSMLFDHIKRLFVLERLAVEIGAALEQAGLFQHSNMKVPIVWPTLRADLPGESKYVFPLHQDYVTTRCLTAWRLWVPLRATDRHHGTMEIAPGSHRTGPFPYVGENTTYPHIERSELGRRGLHTQALELPAGHGVIFSPWLVHGSLPNHSQRTKWVLLLHVQDLATFINPDDSDHPLSQFIELTNASKTAALAAG